MGKLRIVDADIRAQRIETQCEIDKFTRSDQEFCNVLAVAPGNREEPFGRRLQNCVWASEMADQPV
jgi:hypothetical protein